jgi:hypothetical protein
VGRAARPGPGRQGRVTQRPGRPGGEPLGRPPLSEVQPVLNEDDLVHRYTRAGAPAPRSPARPLQAGTPRARPPGTPFAYGWGRCNAPGGVFEGRGGRRLWKGWCADGCSRRTSQRTLARF